MDQYSLVNLSTEPTYISQHGQSLLDVALTTSATKNKFLTTEVIDTGISDGHSMVIPCLRQHAQKLAARTITYRSFKDFDETRYRSDIQSIPFSVAEIFDDPDDTLWAQEMLLMDVLKDHAPMKKKRVRAREPPFLSGKLKKIHLQKDKTEKCLP